jgi:hypothetical protein
MAERYYLSSSVLTSHCKHTSMNAEPVCRPQWMHSRLQHAQQMSLAVKGREQSGQMRGTVVGDAVEAEGMLESPLSFDAGASGQFH